MKNANHNQLAEKNRFEKFAAVKWYALPAFLISGALITCLATLLAACCLLLLPQQDSWWWITPAYAISTATFVGITWSLLKIARIQQIRYRLSTSVFVFCFHLVAAYLLAYLLAVFTTQPELEDVVPLLSLGKLLTVLESQIESFIIAGYGLVMFCACVVIYYIAFRHVMPVLLAMVRRGDLSASVECGQCRRLNNGFQTVTIREDFDPLEMHVLISVGLTQCLLQPKPVPYDWQWYRYRFDFYQCDYCGHCTMDVCVFFGPRGSMTFMEKQPVEIELLHRLKERILEENKVLQGQDVGTAIPHANPKPA